MVCHLLFLSCGVIFQKGNLAVFHQLVHHSNPFFQAAYGQNVRQILDAVKHLAGFHETVIQLILW